MFVLFHVEECGFVSDVNDAHFLVLIFEFFDVLLYEIVLHELYVIWAIYVIYAPLVDVCVQTGHVGLHFLEAAISAPNVNSYCVETYPRHI